MKLSKPDEMLKSHDSLLKIINKVGVNDVSDAINNILDSASRTISADQ